MSDELPQLAIELAAQLQDGTRECVICTEFVGRTDALWSCRRCYGVLHLPCVQFWSRNQTEGGSSSSFRCPLCQNAASTDTLHFQCHCRKLPNPTVDLALTPGSCGQTCAKQQPDAACPHKCTVQCHPGPCPPCGHTREQECHCGAIDKTVGCSSGETAFSCGDICGKELSCGRHYCEAPCHAGACAPCGVRRELTCFCGETVRRDAPCAVEESFRCVSSCKKMMACGKHECGLRCHDGPCNVCSREPSRQHTCACGKRDLDERDAARTSCTDALPSCGAECGFPLACGHICEGICHDGPCTTCSRVETFACRCGKASSKHPCFVSTVPLSRRQRPTADDDEDSDDCGRGDDNPDAFDRSVWVQLCKAHGHNPKTLPKLFPPRCQRRCTTKKSCGKHTCDRTCCGDEEHLCLLVCKKRAPCGVHTCGQLCHSGPCPPCANVSFDPLYCRCRRSVVDPPVPCNTPAPRCNHPCIIPRECGHPANHNCHSDEVECPECVITVEKHCASHGNQLDWHLPCHKKAVSCGKKCGRLLMCCSFVCQAPCHGGDCVHNCTTQYKFPTVGASKK
jgi:hypothetical protein